MRLEARQRPLVAGGALILALAALLLFSMRGSEQPPAAPLLPAPTAPLPAAVAVPPQPAPAPAASPEGLRLHGVLGAGAVIGDAGGGQRFVAMGRDAAPGLTLERVGLDHVMLRSGSGLIRLDFAGAAAVGPAQPAAAGSSGDAALRAATVRYRFGLAPRRQAAVVTGHVVRTGASLPALERAGIRPGDVIVAVNGSRFDQERMLELAWTLANSDDVSFDVERAGRRISLGSQAGVR